MRPQVARRHCTIGWAAAGAASVSGLLRRQPEARRAGEADVQVDVERIAHGRCAGEASLEIAARLGESQALGLRVVPGQSRRVRRHQLGPLQLLARGGWDGGARRQDPGLLQVLGGVDPQLLFAQRQQDEGAEQLRVVDAGDGIARRRQAGVADHRFVEAVIAALRDQAVGDLALRGETRAAAAAGRNEQRGEQRDDRGRRRHRPGNARGRLAGHRRRVGTTRTGERARHSTL